MIIRRAETSDLAALTAISKQGTLSTWSEDAFVSALQLAWSTVLVADAGSEVAGYVVFWLVEKEIEILHIAARLGSHRTGIGTALLNAVIDTAKERGVDRISLEVAENNESARKLYLKADFTVCGRRPNYYPSGDALVMELRL